MIYLEDTSAMEAMLEVYSNNECEDGDVIFPLYIPINIGPNKEAIDSHDLKGDTIFTEDSLGNITLTQEVGSGKISWVSYPYFDQDGVLQSSRTCKLPPQLFITASLVSSSDQAFDVIANALRYYDQMQVVFGNCPTGKIGFSLYQSELEGLSAQIISVNDIPELLVLEMSQESFSEVYQSQLNAIESTAASFGVQRSYVEIPLINSDGIEYLRALGFQEQSRYMSPERSCNMVTMEKEGCVPDLSSERVNFIEYNAEEDSVALDTSESKWFKVIIHDDNHNIRGGLFGQVNEDGFLPYAYVQKFCLDDGVRGTGIGTVVMNMLDKYLPLINVYNIGLSTSSYQAPRFYERMGYEAISIMKIAGIANYQFQKEIAK